MEKALQYLKEFFGYTSFRRGQAEAINDILNGHDTFVLMPTGGGKSIIYQIPALIFDGLTIVISPLISLMKDQVDTLNSMGINSTYINSTLSSSEIEQREMNIKNNKYKLLYIAPERLEALKFFLGTNDIDVSLIAIDEAHCVSQWGHDFRPSYRNISSFISLLPSNPIVLACTATATEIVKNDIVTLLGLRNANLYCTGFNRENLNFKVFRGENKESFILDYVNAHTEETGIIYTATRKSTEHLYSVLMKKGFKAGLYHGGLSEEKRKEMQDAFMFDDINIMVATNAFGMGINKSNIRYVIHANIPADLESYYQEAGRAGRDGGPAEAILIYNEKDRDIQRYLMEKEAEGKKDKNYLNKRLKNFNKMLEYTELKTCYREYILKYFGEKMIRNYCGYCENCKKEKNIKDFSLEAKKIISGVGRAKESLGISTLANMLMGKADTKMLNKGLDKISTFGIMREDKQEWIESFINYMISEKYLIQSAGSFPVLKLGKKYKDILNGNIKIIRKEDEKIDFDYYENNLFKELNSLRKEISKEENIAPYIIFSDMTLIEMAEKKPRNRWDMLKIKGIGNQKYKSYGEKFLERINNYCMEEKL